jgi:hypothetical protein
MELVDNLRAATRGAAPAARALMEQSANCIEHLLTNEDKLTADLAGTKQALVDARREQTAANNKIALLEANKKGAPEARKDLIRRLVAVTISVGFASQIVSLHILERLVGTPVLDPRLAAELARLASTPGLEPRLAAELAHLAGTGQGVAAELVRLITAFFVILLGWDWYDRDVDVKPLGFPRFILDAVIVMAELVLLLSSAKPSLWSHMLLAIFVLYIFWDVLAIIEVPTAFELGERESWRRVLSDVKATYLGGLTGDAKKRGPPINFIWLIYFFLVLLVLPFPGKYGDIALCVMVLLGAVCLWAEGSSRQDAEEPLGPVGVRPLTFRVVFATLKHTGTAFAGLAAVYLTYRFTLAHWT